MTDASAHPADETLSLIGFRVDPDRDHPDVYTLFVIGDKDEPLMSGGYILFFSNPELVDKALKLSDNNNTKQLGPPPQDVDLICDAAKSLYLIECEDIDQSATIINFLNILFDLVKATQLAIPEDYKRVLYGFADHLTFDVEFLTFLVQQNISRDMMRDAILWCIGAVVSKSRIIS